MSMDLPLLPGRSSTVPDWVANQGLLAGKDGNIVLAKATPTIKIEPDHFEGRPGTSEPNGDPLTLHYLQEKVDGDVPGSWQQAKDLYHLGTYELDNGSNDAAQSDLEKAVQIMRTRPPSRPDDATAEKDLMYALGDYGAARTAAKESDNSLDGSSLKARVLVDRQAADTAYFEALNYANKYANPIERSDLLRRKAANEAAFANFYDVNTEAGKIGYRKVMLNAEQDLYDALKPLQSDRSNEGVAAQALTFGDLAYVEMHRADSPHDTDAQDSERHYKTAIDLWHQFDPSVSSDGHILSSSQIQSATDYRDKALLTDLSELSSLLKAENRAKEAEALEPEIQKILAAHPSPNGDQH